jgi:hypothetical protein
VPTSLRRWLRAPSPHHDCDLKDAAHCDIPSPAICDDVGCCGNREVTNACRKLVPREALYKKYFLGSTSAAVRAAQVVQQSAVRQLLETAVEAKQLHPFSVSGADTSTNRVAQLTTKLGSRALNVVKGVLARRLSGGSYAGDLSFATFLAETGFAG